MCVIHLLYHLLERTEAGPNIIRSLNMSIKTLGWRILYSASAWVFFREACLESPAVHYLCSFLPARALPPSGPAAPMDPLNLSWYDDDLERQNWSRPFNGSEGKADRPQYNYYAMLLTLLIFIIVFGNVLVCMAVSREKALQTTTNYLIVSLAVADLLVATLVMPWVVYLEVGLGPCFALGGPCTGVWIRKPQRFLPLPPGSLFFSSRFSFSLYGVDSHNNYDCHS